MKTHPGAKPVWVVVVGPLGGGVGVLLGVMGLLFGMIVETVLVIGTVLVIETVLVFG